MGEWGDVQADDLGYVSRYLGEGRVHEGERPPLSIGGRIEGPRLGTGEVGFQRFLSRRSFRVCEEGRIEEGLRGEAKASNSI